MSNGPGQTLKAAARKIVALVNETEGGVSRETLLATAQRRFPRLPAQVVTALVAEALAAGDLVEADGVLRVLGDGAATDTSPPASGARRGRVVIVDLESVVRTTDVEPFIDKRIFQLGAVRAGADEGWTAEAPVLEQFLELPDASWEIRSPQVRDRHAAAAVPPADALTALHTFCIGAEVVVTYNGTSADMPMLADAFAREDLPGLDVAHVDAYYLALALWPNAPSHRLAQLCDDVGVDRTGLGWHDAVDDAKLLGRLISRARAVIDDWPAAQRQLVAAVCGDSAAWALVLPTGAAATATAFSQPEVAAVLDAQLGAHIPRRQPEPVTTRQPLVVDDTLRDDTGRVNPGLLASVARGAAARTRPAQEQMSAAMHAWADLGVPGLVEAPTGTGKSYAVLACALDWLAGGKDRTAIITTFTKQLQSQLAADVVTIDQNLPGLGLLAAADVVKGQSSRLSVRSLVAALADASSLAGHQGGAERNRFLTEVGFRELLVYVTLRFLSSVGIKTGWTARSVDPVDVPAFFSEYLGRALPVWLESLSQASNGEYPATVGTPIAQHTDMALFHPNT